MLTIANLEKAYGTRTIFTETGLVALRGERIGLIGRNGYGKSTLLKIIAGIEQPDNGVITLEKNIRVGILEQYFVFEGETTLQEAESVLPLIDGAYRETYKAERILEGLGFSEELIQSDPAKLSGGFQIRLNLCKLLLTEPDLLLLDEPTNYLDVISIHWLEQFLLDWEGAAIIVSHDRSFIDRVSTHIALIYRQTIRKTAGKTEKVYQRIEEEEAIHERTRLNQVKEREKQEDFIRTYRSKARQAGRVQSRVKALEKSEMIEKLESEEDLSFSFSYAEFTPKWILQVQELGFTYDQAKFLFQELKFSLSSTDRIAIVGPNGKGKSTLLSLLYSALTPTVGTIDLHTSATVGYLGQSNIERLHPEKTIEDVILEVEANHNRTRARSIAGCMLFSGDAAEKQIKVLSGGEKTRVHLGRIIARPTNILFLDEPTNHLDYHASQALLNALESYPGAVVLVTHSEEFLRQVATRLVVFKNDTAFLFEGDYDDFLRREGWEQPDSEENQKEVAKRNKPTASKTLSKKELRKYKADINDRKNKILKPLKNKITKAEKAIEAEEALIEEEQKELFEITTTGFNDRAADLSRSIARRKEQIEMYFDQMEETSVQLQKEEELLQEQLNAIQ